MIRFSGVSFYPEEEFGLKRLTFEIPAGLTHLQLQNKDELDSVMGLLEGRFQPNSGLIIKENNRVFTQSDRLLLGEKVYSKKAGEYLMLKSPSISLEEKTSSKLFYLDLLKVKHIRHLPIHRLDKEEKINFTLLALLFQEKGLILISELFKMTFSSGQERVFQEILQKRRMAICFVTASPEAEETLAKLGSFNKISPTQNN